MLLPRLLGPAEFYTLVEGAQGGGDCSHLGGIFFEFRGRGIHRAADRRNCGFEVWVRVGCYCAGVFKSSGGGAEWEVGEPPEAEEGVGHFGGCWYCALLW